MDIVKESKGFYRTFFNDSLTDAQVNAILAPRDATK